MTAVTIEEKQREFIKKFDGYEDEFDKYGYVIFLGSQLEEMPKEWKTDENLYSGCLSKIWLHGEIKGGRIFLSADSDTLIVKGLLYLLKELLQGRTLEEVRGISITLFDELDMESVLNETRRKGMRGLTDWLLERILQPVTVVIEKQQKEDQIADFQWELLQKELERCLTLLGYKVDVKQINESDFQEENLPQGKESRIYVRVNKKMQEDSFHILASDAKVLLEGESVSSCLYAVYDFLEQLGMRFYIQEDVFPGKEQEKKIGDLHLDYEKSPFFQVRGLLPFHDFPEGPDWWEKENYNRVMLQLIKMKGNFLGYHVYPENEKEPEKMTAEPLVWIGMPEDVGANGTVKSGYPAQHFRTAGDSWGYFACKTSEYPFGLGRFFTREDMAVSYMKNGPEETYQKNLEMSKEENLNTTFGKYQEIFEKSGMFFSEVLTDAHYLGIKNCIGTETPLTVPKAVEMKIEERMQAESENKKTEDISDEENRKITTALYKGIFTRIRQLYPLDYYWLWTPEDWTWKGNTPEDTRKTIEDVSCALEAKKDLNAGFELAMCGWTLGPMEDRAKFDKLLPEQMPFSCINRHLGFDPVEESFKRISKRPKWAAPWLEDDPALQVPQLWVKRIRKDAADAKEYGCDGLIGIHWRTETIGMNIRALLDAAWQQDNWKLREDQKKEWITSEWDREEEQEMETLAGVEAYVPESVTAERILPADDFYEDFGVHYFGLEKLGKILCEQDSHLPRPCRWEDGPGNIYLNELPAAYIEEQYRFVEEWEKAGELLTDPKALERWRIWLARFRFMRQAALLGCHMASFEKTEEKEKLQEESEVITEIVEKLVIEFCNSICSMGDIGTLAGLVQRNLIPFKKKIDMKLQRYGYQALQWEKNLDKKIRQRCVCLSDPGYLKKKNVWTVRLLALGGTKEVSLYWHFLNDSEIREIKLSKVTDYVFEKTLPAETFGESFCYQFGMDGKIEQNERSIIVLNGAGL